MATCSKQSAQATSEFEMKNQDVFDHIEKAAHTYAKNRRNTSDYLTAEFIENLRMSFIAGVESRPPLRIRHTNTHAAMCCLKD